ncbi:MAG: hypothetical protein ACPHK8_03690 [Thermoplasmatota archaeon]
MKRVVLLAALLLFVPVQAHEAPEAKDQDVRLLHDCVDDYFGSDAFSRSGYDLHTLDLREIYDETLGNALVFRLVLNGEGTATIDVSFKVGSAAKSYKFTKGSGAWTGNFDKVAMPNDIDDGPRFVLEGTVAHSSIGASVGSNIADYNAIGTYPDGEDSLRADDTGLTSSCQQASKPFPDANQDGVPDPYKLKGPVQFFKSTAPSTVQGTVGQQKLVELKLDNKIRTAQNLQFSYEKQGSADIKFHVPGTEQYRDEGSLAIGQKGSVAASGIMHAVVTGSEASTGTVTVEITSNLGGRVVQTFSYTITETSQSSSASSSSSTESEESPGLGVLAFLGIAALAWIRRK